MSRQYLNGRWCIRCNKDCPTPYLRKNIKLLPESGSVLDIGCGNGRNSKFMLKSGYDVDPFDMAPPDFGIKLILGENSLPNKKYNIILANYVLMFLDNETRQKVMEDLDKVSQEGTFLIMEMYPAKDAHEYDFDEMTSSFFNKGWIKIRKSKDKCVLRKGSH